MSLNIKLLPDGTPEDRARMAKSLLLAEAIDRTIRAHNITDGIALEAVGMIWGSRAKTLDQAQKHAAALSTAVLSIFQLRKD